MGDMLEHGKKEKIKGGGDQKKRGESVFWILQQVKREHRKKGESKIYITAN